MAGGPPGGARESPGSNTTRLLSDFVAGLRFQAIPAAVVERVKRQVLDVIGVAVAGMRGEAGQIVARYAERQGSRATSSVWGTRLRVSASDAAFANGVAAHALEFDDIWLPGSHPSAAIVPAAFALAESVQASGRELITAALAGYEVMGRVAAAASGRAGWHPTGIFGVFGAAAASARLLRLDADTTAAAFGIASSNACGIDVHEGTMTKPLHAGLAARSGVVAALLAQDGFTASPTVFDSARGFFGSFYRGLGYEPWRVTAGLGQEPYYIMSPGIGLKAYPAGYLMHHAYEAALQLVVKHDLRDDDIDGIEISFLPGSRFNRPHVDGGLAGKFSLQYVVAMAILDRRLDVDSFSDAKALSTPVQALLSRMTARIDDSLPNNHDIWYTPVTFTLKDGRRLTAVQPLPKSHWRHPLPDEEWVGKFLDNTGPTFGAPHARRLCATLRRLEEVDVVAEVGGLLVRTEAP